MAGFQSSRTRVEEAAEEEAQRAKVTGLQYMADQQDMRVVWPAASWGRK